MSKKTMREQLFEKLHKKIKQSGIKNIRENKRELEKLAREVVDEFDAEHDYI